MRRNSVFKQGVNRITHLFMAVFLMILTMAMPAQSDAAGLLIADGGFGGVLEIEEHAVDVTINNGIAVTNVTQVFRNTENRQVEALYTFPVPKGASVANFSMWINGKEMIGEVVEKERARQIYESYKQTRRDPGLLEQVNYKTFEMRIFPINAGADQKVRLTYYQELNVDHNQATYVYPLATVTRNDIDQRTTGRFAIDISVKSAIPIVELSSPSHTEDFVVATHTERYHQASLEVTGGSLAEDVVVNYDISRPKTGFDLITSRQKDEDGYFCMTIATGEELEKMDAGMDYVFVLDVSGSMANDGKLIISKKALNAFIGRISEKDRFEVMTFNVAPQTVFGQLKPGNGENQEIARTFMASQRAAGGTELAPALRTAYKYGDADRPLNVVILSDGMTEQTERRVLLQMIGSRPRNAKVFCIGIGNEVNRPMLQQMAKDSGGLAAFISGNDDFDRAAQAFRRKLMRPVASDLQIQFGGLQVYDVTPPVLPNLYHGFPIRIYGRYKGSGESMVTLSGNIQGVAMEKSVRLSFPEVDSANPEIDRMWALKRVDELLKKADRNGSRAAVLDDIIRLGEGYSIVTEYTSFLVLENDAEYRRWKIDRKNMLRLDRDRAAQRARKDRLERLKERAVSNIGPMDPSAKTQEAPTLAQAPVVDNQPPHPDRRTSTPDRRPSRSQSRDISFGAGPVGPLFAGIALWLRRRKLKRR